MENEIDPNKIIYNDETHGNCVDAVERNTALNAEAGAIAKELKTVVPGADLQLTQTMTPSNAEKESQEAIGDKNCERIANKETIIIESVIQLVPAIDVSKGIATPVEMETNVEKSKGASLTQETDNIEVMYVAKTEDTNESLKCVETMDQENIEKKENTTTEFVIAPKDIETTTEHESGVVTVLDTIALESMDAMPTEEVQFVVSKTSNEKSKNSQSGIEKVSPLTTNGLGLLLQYGSGADDSDSNESDTASIVEVPSTTNKSYRTQVVEIESDSTETISSDSDSETETEYLTKIAKVINKRIAANDNHQDGEDDDDDDEDDKTEGDDNNTKTRTRRQPPRVRGEILLDDLPPIQDLKISVPAEECIEFGRVNSIIDQLLLVSALPNAILLDLDTVLFLDQGKRVLGEVFDVLGQVADPLYCVRFNTHEHIQEKGISIGDIVYVAPKTDYTQYIILSSLMKFRGSDASWENDIEPPPRYLDYSDDEEEREARHQLRKHRRQSIKEENVDESYDDDADDKGNDPMKRSCMSADAESFRIPRNRPDRPGGSKQNNNSGGYQKRTERFGGQTYSPRNYQPRQNTSSWHSHYNAQYQPRSPAHSYRSPYSGPYQYQRPLYRPPPPGAQQFNPYVHSPMAMPTAQAHLSHPPPMGQPPQMTAPPPPMYGVPPPQFTPPSAVHSMPPPPLQATPPSATTYVPNPFAFRAPTLSPQPQMQQPLQTQSQSPIRNPTTEPAPPGAD